MKILKVLSAAAFVVVLGGCDRGDDMGDQTEDRGSAAPDVEAVTTPPIVPPPPEPDSSEVIVEE